MFLSADEIGVIFSISKAPTSLYDEASAAYGTGGVKRKWQIRDHSRVEFSLITVAFE